MRFEATYSLIPPYTEDTRQSSLTPCAHTQQQHRLIKFLFVMRAGIRRLLNMDEIVQHFKARHNISGHVQTLENLFVSQQV